MEATNIRNYSFIHQWFSPYWDQITPLIFNLSTNWNFWICHVLAIESGWNQILVKESIYFSLQYCYCIKGFKYLHQSRFVWNCGPPLYYKVHRTQTNVCKFVSPFMKFLYTNVSSWIFMPYLYAIMAHYHV